MLTCKYQIHTIRLCVKLFKQINIPIIQFPGCPTLIPSWLHQTAVEKLYPGTIYSKPLIKDVLRTRRARHECNCNILQSLCFWCNPKKSLTCRNPQSTHQPKTIGMYSKHRENMGIYHCHGSYYVHSLQILQAHTHLGERARPRNQVLRVVGGAGWIC